MGIKIVEHKKESLLTNGLLDGVEDVVQFYKTRLIAPRKFPNHSATCFNAHLLVDDIELEANYYIGLDWLVGSERYIHVLPKMNKDVLNLFEKRLEVENPEGLTEKVDEDPYLDDTNFSQLDYIRMFMDAMQHPVIANYTDGLIFIDWDSKEIEIEQKEDALTPFLVVQFLNLLKQIVRKGLKKSYYKVQEHLTNRVKGKISVGTNIKSNVLKNRLTKTYCEYQEFGYDGAENRFLKKVLKFVQHYVVLNKTFFKGTKETIDQMIAYCLPVFGQVSDHINDYELKHFKHNPFFKEYEESIKIGNYILKRFSYNISNTSNQKIKTPPFWIDMPRLFELYVYHHLLEVFDKSEIIYHFRTYGNELDFLLQKDNQKMVIDAKYKLHYKTSHVHEDIRQVSGYARLKTVYNKLGLEDSRQLIDCLIIYPDNSTYKDDYKLDLKLKSEIKAYERVFKMGIPIPKI